MSKGRVNKRRGSLYRFAKGMGTVSRYAKYGVDALGAAHAGYKAAVALSELYAAATSPFVVDSLAMAALM